MSLPKISKTPYTDKPNLKDLDLPEIEACIAPLGKETYRARQIMKWLYQHGAESFEEMTTLSKDFRTALNDIARIGQPDIEKIQTSADGTKKVLFRLEDGLLIESVLIPGKNHWTVCVSTQAGCQMGCTFCLTGKQGFKRNL
ncbi:MAG: 23S rRNA (adenine(2503)-C(2))-methyltransferase RlmN, partial [Deltaproteobacteria bacterium]